MAVRVGATLQWPPSTSCSRPTWITWASASLIDGDRIYNGAMDNASGIATLLGAARRLGDAPPRRSIVFLALTAEEQGLLGSRYFAAHPTVARDAIVADVNVDMFLPLYPMRSVIGYGADESDLGDDLRRAAADAGRQRRLRIRSRPAAASSGAISTASSAPEFPRSR